MSVRCPDCGRDKLLAWYSIPLLLTSVPNLDAGGVAGIGEPWGSSFPIGLKAEVTCNHVACGWEGTLRELAEKTGGEA